MGLRSNNQELNFSVKNVWRHKLKRASKGSKKITRGIQGYEVKVTQDKSVQFNQHLLVNGMYSMVGQCGPTLPRRHLHIALDYQKPTQ